MTDDLEHQLHIPVDSCIMEAAAAKKMISVRVKTFAQPQWVCEIDVDTSKYRIVHRFAQFFNLPELSRVFSQIASFCAMDGQGDTPRLEGRILRKGNLYAEIKIFRYITEGSFGSCSWQLLETKQRFISQFLAGSEYQRSASDLEKNVLACAQVKSLAIANPVMKELAEKENELRRLELLSSNHSRTREAQKAELSARREKLARLDRELEAARQNAAYVGGISEKDFQAAYGNLKTVLTRDVVFRRTLSPAELSALGFDVAVPEGGQENDGKPHVIVSRNGMDYPVPMGESAAGNARRLLNFLKRFPQLCAEIQERREGCRTEIQRLEVLGREKNPYLNRMKALECEIVELRSQIS